jgi:NAD(P)-dependent dehydrogenase (short-subunit alcohol dehydrogenase family)
MCCLNMLRSAVELAALRGGAKDPQAYRYNDAAAATRLIDRIASEVGPPDVLVNTIGAFRPGDALTTTPETLQLMIDVNLGPALWLSQAVAPHMQQQGTGVIVHVTARPGIEPSGAATTRLPCWPRWPHKPPCSHAVAERRWNCASYLMMRPPSAHSTWPVIAAAASEAR